MTARTHTFPLRLPRSLKDAAERVAREDGTSINQLVVTALAEKLSAMRSRAACRKHQDPGRG